MERKSPLIGIICSEDFWSTIQYLENFINSILYNWVYYIIYQDYIMA